MSTAKRLAVGEVVEAMIKELGQGGVVATATRSNTTIAAPVAQAASSSSSASADDATRIVLEVLAEKTGYESGPEKMRRPLALRDMFAVKYFHSNPFTISLPS